jgi:ankyrin repeat protein
MQQSFVDFLKQNPGELNAADEAGYTLLHKETIAGNRTTVEVLLQQGADASKRTASGKTALDYARQLNWEHLLPVLEGK